MSRVVSSHHLTPSSSCAVFNCPQQLAASFTCTPTTQHLPSLTPPPPPTNPVLSPLRALSSCAVFNSPQLAASFSSLLSPLAEDTFPAHIIIQGMGLVCVGGPNSAVSGVLGGAVDSFEGWSSCGVQPWVQVPTCPT